MRDIAYWSGGAAAEVFVTVEPIHAQLLVAKVAGDGDAGYAHWIGRQVVNPGERLEAWSSDTDGTITITGYELQA